MRPINLDEIIPQPATLKLKATDKIYHLRPLDLDDEAWLKARFGDQLNSIFSNIKIAEIAEIAFNQLEDTDKEDFVAQDVTIVDGKGEKHSIRLGGAQLLAKLIRGYDDKLAVFRSLIETIGISRPMFDGLVAEAEAQEKKSLTSPRNQLTGDGSLTPSPQNTGGPSEKLES